MTASPHTLAAMAQSELRETVDSMTVREVNEFLNATDAAIRVNRQQFESLKEVKKFVKDRVFAVTKDDEPQPDERKKTDHPFTITYGNPGVCYVCNKRHL